MDHMSRMYWHSVIFDTSRFDFSWGNELCTMLINSPFYIQLSAFFGFLIITIILRDSAK